MDHYSDGSSHFTVEKVPGRTVIFSKGTVQEVDIGIHDHEVGHPQGYDLISKYRYRIRTS